MTELHDRPGVLFTVLTPTFNRTHTIERVFHSLRLQTCRDFEWLVVDDGSTDHMARLIEEWQRDADFRIIDLHQANAGRHVAFNTGVRAARGTLVVPLDSDDGCVPEALDHLRQAWEAIPAADRDGFVGVNCTCLRPDGRRYGKPLSEPVFDADARTVYFRLDVRQELWGCARRDALRARPFPEDRRRVIRS